MGIYEDLDEVFTTMAPNIMGAAMALAMNSSTMDSLHYTVEGSTIGEAMKLRWTLSPSAIGALPVWEPSSLTTLSNLKNISIANSPIELTEIHIEWFVIEVANNNRVNHKYRKIEISETRNQRMEIFSR